MFELRLFGGLWTAGREVLEVEVPNDWKVEFELECPEPRIWGRFGGGGAKLKLFWFNASSYDGGGTSGMSSLSDVPMVSETRELNMRSYGVCVQEGWVNDEMIRQWEKDTKKTMIEMKITEKSRCSSIYVNFFVHIYSISIAWSLYSSSSLFLTPFSFTLIFSLISATHRLTRSQSRSRRRIHSVSFLELQSMITTIWSGYLNAKVRKYILGTHKSY